MKTRISLIVLLLLLVAAAGLVWLMDPWSTTGTGLSALLPQEPEKVTTVQVISEFDTLVFHRADSVWMMEGEEVNPDAVDNLVFAASRLSLRSILPADEVKVPGGAVEFVFRSDNRKSTRSDNRKGTRTESTKGSVKDSRETFRNSGVQEGHFFFAASASGYIVFMPGEDHYYGVELPGYTGLSLEKIFSGNADHYRVHLLADLLPSEIALVEVQPWKGTAFMVRQDSAYNVHVRLAETGADVTGEVDEHKIRLLFSYFNAIRYDRVAGEEEVDPGSLSPDPWASVAVTTFEGVRRQFDVYQWIQPGETDADLFEALVVFNGRPLLLVVNYYYLDLLIRGLEDYQ